MSKPADLIAGASKPEKIVYAPDDVRSIDYDRDLADPGHYPYTRGVYPTMYQGRHWTMRQFAGFGSARDTNERYKFLLKEGQTGLSVAFDMPTLMGLDADDPLAMGEVGRCGVAISCLEDMETLFDGIPLGKVSTSMTINGPAAITWAMYIAAAERQGVPMEDLRGTTQNDILKEYIAQKEYLFPPKPSMRLVTDTVEFASQRLPYWHPVSVSGYHIREAGSTAVQELAFTLSDGFAYVEDAIARGLDVDSFAPRLSFFFNSHNDFFEEICKFRAARRIYAKRMKEKYGAKNPKSLLMRFHTQTAGCTLTAQQPENNVVRVAYQALAGVLGGTQSLHTNSMDETLALPTEKAVQLALRTQQVLAFETGVTEVVDPLAGSYFVEARTDEMEKEAERYFEKIDELGGVVGAIENGFQVREIGKAASRYQEEVDHKKRVIVGLNEFVQEESGTGSIDTLKIDMRVEKEQAERLRALRQQRNATAYDASMTKVTEACQNGENLMPHFLEAVKCGATLGELVHVLKREFGEYREPAVF